MFHGPGLFRSNSTSTHPDSVDDTGSGKTDQYYGEDLPAIHTTGTVDNRQYHR